MPISKSNAHLAGEFFAAAELAKRDYNVAMTMGNAKRIDLLIESETKTLSIQVKAISGSVGTGWPLPATPEAIDTKSVFIFVKLNDNGVNPEYYIMTGRQVVKNGLFGGHGSRSVIRGANLMKRFKGNWKLIDTKMK